MRMAVQSPVIPVTNIFQTTEVWSSKISCLPRIYFKFFVSRTELNENWQTELKFHDVVLLLYFVKSEGQVNLPEMYHQWLVLLKLL